MNTFFYDGRWCASHGIGRFATEVRKRLTNLADLPMSGSPTHPFDAWKLARCLKRSRAQGFFSPGFNVPAWARCPVVTTIHDLIHLHCRGERSLAKSAYYRFLQRRMVRHAQITLTVSQYSRQEIIQWYGVSPERVVCVGNGVSADFTPDGRVSESDVPYFLYVGNTRPHKNVPLLLDAYRDLVARQSIQLVLVTKPCENLEREIAQRGLTADTRILSGLSDSELATWYRGAIALLMPSLYEGFGLPVVEAMACGCPVIAANRTSLPEVVGDAGLLVDPTCPIEWVDAMRSMLESERMRVRFREQGIARSQQFSWDNVASRIQESIAPLLAA